MCALKVFINFIVTLFACPASLKKKKKQKEISIFYSPTPVFFGPLRRIAFLSSPLHSHTLILCHGTLPGQHITPRVASYSLLFDSSSSVAVFLSRLPNILHIYGEGICTKEHQGGEEKKRKRLSGP